MIRGLLALVFAAPLFVGCPSSSPDDDDGGATRAPPTVLHTDGGPSGSPEPDAPEPDAPEPDAPEPDAPEPDAPEPDVVTPDPEPGLASAGCGIAPPPGGEWTVAHGGVSRSFHVRLPASYDDDTPTPVVLGFHGRGITAGLHESTTGFTSLGAEEGFIAVYPEGIGQTWNAGVCCGEAAEQDIDDVGFVHAVLDALEAALCVDRGRVYASGLSNGAFFSYRLACEMSERITAIGAVAGVTGVFPCAPTRPVPVFHFHGTDDNVVPYEGNFGFSAMSVDSNMEAWVERNGCQASAVMVFDEDDVTCAAWTGCDDGAEVRLCTIEGGGHQWPGGVSIPLLGANTDAISATAELWSFFAAHPLP